MNTQTKPQQRQQQQAPAQQQVATQQSKAVPAKDVPLHVELSARDSEFRAALPAHIPVERFKRVILTAVSTTPQLIKADRRSFFNSAMKAAQDGLLPDGREGALVIYEANVKTRENGSDVWNKVPMVQWMPMIAGLRKKVRNSKEISTWDVKAVYQKDQFAYREGLNQQLDHVPYLEGHPGPLIAVYSIARLKSGEVSIDVMPKWQVDKVRDLSKAKEKGPWGGFYDEMAKKTVARRHSKVLPMSTDLDDLIRRDDTLYDLEGASDREVKSLSSTPRPHPSEFVDSHSGEIIDAEPINKEPPAATLDKSTERAEAATGGDNGKAAAKAPEEKRTPDQKSSGAEAAEQKSPKQQAADIGYAHAKEGRALRAMPPEYREDEGLKDAYTAGWEHFFEEQRAND